MRIRDRFWKTIFVLFTFLLLTISAAAEDYDIEISGDYEVGEKTYIDVYNLEEGLNEDYLEVEEILDYYTYNKLWLKFKQDLEGSDYYYVKAQYNEKEYKEKITYNNRSLDIWTNYTFNINDKLRNKIKIDYRDKEYVNNDKNTYHQLRLKYQIDYEFNPKNDYSLYIQRQWKDYPEGEEKDNVYDRVSVSWDWDLTDNLTVRSGIQLDWTKYKPVAESSDKDSKKFNVGFKLDL